VFSGAVVSAAPRGTPFGMGHLVLLVRHHLAVASGLREVVVPLFHTLEAELARLAVRGAYGHRLDAAWMDEGRQGCPWLLGRRLPWSSFAWYESFSWSFERRLSALNSFPR
jgi:hypothetical protein